MARLSERSRRLIIKYNAKGLSSVKITRLLESEHDEKTTRQTVLNFLKRYKSTGSFTARKKSKNGEAHAGTKIRKVHLDFLGMWIEHDPEVTARSLQHKMKSVLGVNVSTSYVCKLRKEMGWTAKHVKYCQLISHKNKQVRLDWALNALRSQDDFRNVVFVDETTVEMSANGRLCFYQPGSRLECLPPKAAKPKHAYKVHVWGGISYHGRTDICVFTGIMDSKIYQQILDENFIPWANEMFPEGFRLYQDNDSKHRSKSTTEWFRSQQIEDNIMVTPASSPDLNPIENVWSALKGHLQTSVKPRTKEELVSGIMCFWESLTAGQCAKYIDHMHKVIPHVVLNRGGATIF